MPEEISGTNRCRGPLPEHKWKTRDEGGKE